MSEISRRGFLKRGLAAGAIGTATLYPIFRTLTQQEFGVFSRNWWYSM